MKMKDDIQPDVLALARGYLDARRKWQDSITSMQQKNAAFIKAEGELIDGIMDGGTDEDEGTSVVVDSVCLALKDECWDYPEGDRLAIYKLLQVAP